MRVIRRRITGERHSATGVCGSGGSLVEGWVRCRLINRLAPAPLQSLPVLGVPGPGPRAHIATTWTSGVARVSERYCDNWRGRSELQHPRLLCDQRPKLLDVRSLVQTTRQRSHLWLTRAQRGWGRRSRIVLKGRTV